jgi:GTP cyclohydrolase IIa
MIKIGFVQLIDYEDWIKSFGHDREWAVQAAQADTNRSFTLESAQIDAFSIPLTYDSYVIILNSVSTRKYEKMIHKLSQKVPVKLKAYIGFGKTYVTALNSIRELKSCNSIATQDDIEYTVAVHVDLNNYYGIIREKNWHYVYEVMNNLITNVRNLSNKYGGLTFYAGGDNVISFMPSSTVKNFIDEIVTDSVKIGVGVASTPREALKLASTALDIIRDHKSKNQILVLRSES